MPTLEAKRRSLLRKRQDVLTKENYKREFYSLCQKHNFIVIFYSEGTFSREKAHKVKCACGSTRTLSLFDLRRSKGVCSNCSRQHLSKISCQKSHEKKQLSNVFARKPLIYIPTETNLPPNISSLKRSKDKTIYIFQHTAKQRKHEI